MARPSTWAMNSPSPLASASLASTSTVLAMVAQVPAASSRASGAAFSTTRPASTVRFASPIASAIGAVRPVAPLASLSAASLPALARVKSWPAFSAKPTT